MTGADRSIAAGGLDEWVQAIRDAHDRREGMDVPCGSCDACCRASLFIHVEPDETAALAAIPRELLVPAPGWPEGVMVMGHDEEGRCPMLAEAGCSIYDARPRCCRLYDCRVFAATGVRLDRLQEAGVAERVAKWKFVTEANDEAGRLPALRAAAAFIVTRRDTIGADVPDNSADVALLAVGIHELFIGPRQPSLAEVAAAIDACVGG